VKAKELRDSTVEELKQKEKETREELFNLKIQLSTNQLPNTAKVKQVRRDVALLKTIQGEKKEEAIS